MTQKLVKIQITQVFESDNENVENKLDSFEKIGYFVILPIDCIGDDESSLYSKERGFNYHPEIVEIL